MPRILRVINRFNIGGPTYNAAYLSKYLPSDYETILVGGSPQAHEAHSGYILDQLGVPYTEIPEMGRRVRLLDDWRAFRKLCAIIRQVQPDIVHTHAAKAGALGRIAARWCGVPVVVHTYHGHVFSGYFTGFKNTLVKSIERMLGRMTTAVIAISPIQRKEISELHGIVPMRKMHVIPLGFDLSRFETDQDTKRAQFRTQYSLQDNQVAVGIIGRLTAIKQHELFLKSFGIAASSQPLLVAFVVGDGERMQELQAMWGSIAAQHGLASDRLQFTSWIKAVDVALAGLDLVAMTSLNEGTPVSLIEAQAACKPVITTDVGGVADCVDDNRSGLIVRSHDPIVFADAMIHLANDGHHRAAMGRLGRTFVTDRYSYVRLVNDVVQLYDELLRQK
jgi:glycosyltransferase involved in cell wall biosynthesis